MQLLAGPLTTAEVERPVILILASDNDEHAELVSAHLTGLGAPFRRLSLSQFPQQLSISLEIGGASTIRLADEANDTSRTLDLDDIQAVWFRRAQRPAPDASLPSEDAAFVQAECEHVLNALYRLLPEAKWLNTPTQISSASYKPDQLSVAQRLGLAIPRTLVSNDPDRCRVFYDRCNGAVIYKSLSGYMRPRDPGKPYETIFTNIVEREDFLSRLASIKLSPCLFQEYVEKAYELRITIVGSKLFAAKIESQQSARSSIDWRRYDLQNTPYSAYCLPDEISLKLLTLMRHYGLSFGCVDMIVTPSGEFYFIEINPNGQWFWVEQLTGLRISNEIAGYLANRPHPQKRAVEEER